MASYYMLTTLAFISLNVILLVISIGAVAAGCSLMIFGLQFKALVGNVVSAAPIVLVTIAIATFFLSLLGTIGTFLEKRTFLITYFACMLVIFMVLMVGIMVTFVKHQSLDRIIIERLRKSLNDTTLTTTILKSESPLQKVWDKLQCDQKCCGFDGYKDWRMLNRQIPQSCLALNLTILNQLPDVSNNPYYAQGCKVPVHNHFFKILMRSGITSISIATIQVFCIVASLANYCYVKTSGGFS